MTNVNALLDRKYDIMAKKANAAMIRAKASANLSDAQAEKVGAEAAELARQEIEGAGSQQSLSLPALDQLVGASPSGGAGLGLGSNQTSSLTTPATGPTQPTRQQAQSRTSSTAPQGFGLSTNDDATRQRARVSNVFGSLFDNSRGL